MITFLNAKYNSIGEKNFTILAPILCFLADILIVYYINNVYLEQMLNIKALAPAFAIQGINVYSLPKHELQSLLDGVKMTASNMFWILLIYHFIIYSCFIKGIRWARKYVKGYALTGSVLSVAEILIVGVSTHSINQYTLASTILYLFVYLGLRHFKKIVAQ